jgi:ABC-2 type transport system ATP-binding protein
VIELKGLTKRFGSMTAVDSLDIKIHPGELFAFLGPNGAGKTTTIKMIVGLLRPTDGRVTLCGHDVQQDSIAAKSLLSYVPDQPYLYDKLTGREFLEFVARMYGLPRSDTGRKIAQMAEWFELAGFLDELGETYSHGMKQRVVITAALLHDPQVLVVDEPLVGLDPKGANTLKQVFRDSAERGVTIFMSTHTLALAEEIADTVGILNRGHLIATGSPESIRLEATADARLEDAFLALTRDTAGADTIGLGDTG